MYGKKDSDRQPVTRYFKKFDIVETETELPIQGQVQDPEDLYTFFKDLQNEQVPKLIAIYLDADFLFLGHQVFLGATAATLETSLVYHYFSLFLAKKFILILNHPNGDPQPTEEDLKLMRALIVDSNALSFRPSFADYIIIGAGKYFSMSVDQGTAKTATHEHVIHQSDSTC
jgi:DNA repair protein RadC